MFPTIVRLIETSKKEGKEEKQIDIFSIDNNGIVLAHTNKSWVDGEEVEIRDTSLERLSPYKADILNAPNLLFWAQFRLTSAFDNHNRSKGNS
jgi:hypothetical protein